MQNPLHTYTTGGTYDVTLVVTNTTGCSDTVVQSNFAAIANGNADFSVDVDTGCVPLTVNFTDNTNLYHPISTYQWEFGDGNTSTAANPSNTYNTAGNFTITLIVEDTTGCIDTLVRTNYIRTGAAPTAGFSGSPLTLCIDSPVTFTDASIGANQWAWDFGDGNTSNMQNPIHSYADTGSFTVILAAGNNGCWDTLVQAAYININTPRADFSQFIGGGGGASCGVPATVVFTDLSVLPDTWFWEFGDGNTSTLQNPIHVYTTAGTFFVKLTVTDTLTGCTNEHLDTVVISNPVADFSSTTANGCAPFGVQFFDNSTAPNSIYNWDFGDGSFSTSRNPFHTYTSPGVFTVILQVTDTLTGCTFIEDKVAYANIIGIDADFTADVTDGCAGQLVNFTDVSTTGSTINTWSWDFGDGNTSNLQNPSNTYTVSGVYTVALTVTDLAGCTKTTEKLQYINITAPTVNVAGPSVICLEDSAMFVNLSTEVGNTYLWAFGDGNSAMDFEPKHQYTATGFYNVTVTATDTNGCTNVNGFSVQVVQLVIDTLPNDTVCLGDTVTFSVTGGQIYQWSNGSTDTSITVAPLSTTSYAVTVIDSLGCLFIDTAQVVVNPLPIADAGDNDTICIGETGTLTASGGATYLWSMGGGTNPIANYTPTTTTTYYVTVTTAAGCTGIDSATIVVNPLPVVTVTNDTICIGQTGTLTASGGGTYLWSNAGGIGSSASFAPVVTTSYSVTVTTANGCTATGSGEVSVNLNPTITTFNDTVCFGDAGTIGITAPNPTYTYVWSNGTVDTALVGVPNGTYFITATDTNGCTVTDSAQMVQSDSLQVVINGVDNVTCFCESDGAIDVTILGAPLHIHLAGAALLTR